MKRSAYTVSTMFAALTLASAAHAADVSAPASFDWSGFYLGANSGISWNNSNVNNSFDLDGDGINEITNKINGDQTAFTAGGLVGYNYQIDQIVLGVEADLNYLGFSDNNTRSVDFEVGNLDNLTSKSSFEADWFGTIRGRLGYAIDNLLIYGTGGLAYGHVSAKGKVTADDGLDLYAWKGSIDSTNWGWTIGAGAEYGVDNWGLGLEYLYADLGSGQWNGSNDVFGSSRLKGDADFAFSTVRATVKYRFQ